MVTYLCNRLVTNYNIMTKERNRELSEEKLIHAIGELIEEVGFEKLGINQVAKRAGFSKNLIYRYFGSLDGLIYAYMEKHDFWTNVTTMEPGLYNLKGYLKTFFRKQIIEYRGNTAFKRLLRWELSTDKDILIEIRAQREKNGLRFTKIISRFSKINQKELQAISALMNAGITYLAMFEENCQMYNGIDIRNDKGWKQIAKGIDTLIDIMIK